MIFDAEYPEYDKDEIAHYLLTYTLSLFEATSRFSCEILAFNKCSSTAWDDMKHCRFLYQKHTGMPLSGSYAKHERLFNFYFNNFVPLLLFIASFCMYQPTKLTMTYYAFIIVVA